MLIMEIYLAFTYTCVGANINCEGGRINYALHVQYICMWLTDTKRLLHLAHPCFINRMNRATLARRFHIPMYLIH